MTLLKGSDTNSREINVALLSLEADIKNKIANFDTSVIDRQLAEINSRIDKINASGSNSSAEINDVRTEIENINSKLRGNSAKIESIEQKLSDIFSAENKVTDFNATTDSGVYYWIDSSANRPSGSYGSSYGVLLVNKYDGGSNLWINQIAYGTNNRIYFRQNIDSGSWTSWKAVAYLDDIEQKLSNMFLANKIVTDFNTTTDAGTYFWANSSANRPTDYGVLLVNKYGGGNNSAWINQVAYGTDNRIYFRQNINSSGWTSWKVVC